MASKSRKLNLFTAISVIAFLAIACGFIIYPHYSRPQPMPSPDGVEREGPTQPLAITTADGKSYQFNVEIADNEPEWERGLMFRTHMDDNHGMLFLFGDVADRAFWMKNTYIPLDILFLDQDGKIHHIAANAKPQDETPLPSGGAVLHVLEINGGICARLGIKEGDVVHHPAFGNVLAQ
jgi:uncharacterized membrane protein (UPF0127 family)